MEGIFMKCKYIPIIRNKAGEKNALDKLADDIKKDIIPLIEIVDLTKSAEGKWEDKFFYLYIYENLYKSADEFKEILNQYQSKYMIPVLLLEGLDEYIKILSKKKYERVAIRINRNDLINNLKKLEVCLAKLNLDKIDIVVDFQEITSVDLSNDNIAMYNKAIKNINSFTHVDNIIIASGSIPSSMSGYEKYEILELDRLEYTFFSKLDKLNNFIFSDYCTRHFEYKCFNHPVHRYFNIKYTLLDKYLLVKGELDGLGDKKENIIPRCKSLIKDKRYCGKNYSYGDKYIYERSKDIPKLGYGNSTTWITTCINHHITFIVRNI